MEVKRILMVSVVVLLIASFASADEMLLTPATSPVGTLRDDYTGSLGILFKVNDHVTVSKLGFYDHNSDGLTQSHVVRIWESNDNNGNYTVIAQATIPAGTGAVLADGFRWVDLPTTVNLIRTSPADANWYCLTAEVVNGSGDSWYNTGVTGFDYADYMYSGYWDARWGTSNQIPSAGATAADAWYVVNMSAGLADKLVDVNVVSRVIDMSDFNGTTRFNASSVDNMRLAGISNIREPFSLGTVFSTSVVPSLEYWQDNKDDPDFIDSLNWYSSPHNQIVNAGFNWTLLILDMPPCLVNAGSVPDKGDVAAWTAFGEMCGVVYEHYKDMINYVEIGNELEFGTNITGTGYANNSETAADYYYYAWQGISPTLEVGISGPGSFFEPWAWAVTGFDYIVGGRGGVPASPVTAAMMDDVSVHIYTSGNGFIDSLWDWARVRVDGGIWPSRWNPPVSNLAGKDLVITEWDFYWEHPFPGMSFYGNILNQMIKTGTKNYIYECWETFGNYQWGTIAYDIYRQAGVFVPGTNVYVHDDPTHENTSSENFTAVSLEDGSLVLLAANQKDSETVTNTWSISNFTLTVGTDANTKLLRVLDTANNPTGSNNMYDYALTEVFGSGNGYTVVQDGTDVTVTLTMEPDSINAIVLFANVPPSFSSDPIFIAVAIEGMNYSGTLTDKADDENAGDTLTFSKVSGPEWLTISSEGELSGVPKNDDISQNSFAVRVTDADGLYDDATLSIYVLGRYTGELGPGDLEFFVTNWLDSDCGLCGFVDLDGDSDVDMDDWAIFAGYWLK